MRSILSISILLLSFLGIDSLALKLDNKLGQSVEVSNASESGNLG